MKGLIVLTLMFLGGAANGAVFVRKEQGRIWPHGTIPYWIQPQLVTEEPALYAVIKIALAEWAGLGIPATFEELKAPIVARAEFVAKSKYSCTQLTGAGSAPVGYYSQMDKHEVCLDPEHATTAVVLHELAHVAGLVHEHQHCKRDEYMFLDFSAMGSKIVTGVGPGLESNYGLQNCDLKFYSSSPKSTLPYDWGSLMHYRLGQGLTLTPRGRTDLKYSGLAQGDVGRGRHLSPSDIAALKALYSP